MMLRELGYIYLKNSYRFIFEGEWELEINRWVFEGVLKLSLGI